MTVDAQNVKLDTTFQKHASIIYTEAHQSNHNRHKPNPIKSNKVNPVE